MTVVTSQFRWDFGTPWCSGAGASAEPWYKINTQLLAWVNGINDANKISIVFNPAQNTTLNSATSVAWLLSTPESSNHLRFFGRPGNSSSSGDTYNTYAWWGRTAGTANNGLGNNTDNVQLVDSSCVISAPSATVRQLFFTAYEFDTALPWFFIGQWAIDSLSSGIKGTMIARVDYSAAAIGNNNPVPSGTSPWVILQNAPGYINIAQTADTRATGLKGTTANGLTNAYLRDYDMSYAPQIPLGGVFYKPSIPWGARYPIGRLPDNILCTGLGSYGVALETVVYAGKTYTKLSNTSARVAYWLRID